MEPSSKTTQQNQISKTADILAQTYDTHQAAEFCGVATVTMRNSRMTGLLCGVKAPPFRKIGRRVIYLRDDLSHWLNALPAYHNTTEAKMNEVV